MVDLKNTLGLQRDGQRQLVDNLIQLAEKSTVCIGQGNFYEIDYLFISQVGGCMNIIND